MLEQIIQQTSIEMLEEITDIVVKHGVNLEEILPKVLSTARKSAKQIIEHIISETDEAFHNDKAGRKKEGWVVERRGDRRVVMTELGAMEYKRTYYHNSKTNEYSYPIDQIVGVLPYHRIEQGLSKKLVSKSRHFSYQRTVDETCEGRISKQTVLNKIRKAKPIIAIPPKKKQVPELHVDADEDHVALQDPKHRHSTIVPLVSIYEGVESDGKRRHCKNVFHISTYKQKPDELWEDVLTRIEQRYDLTHTKIYLHGDGASWITQGMEWLPNAVFVLDMYHKNKYIQQMLAGYSPKKVLQLRKDIEQALYDMDEDYFGNIVQLLVSSSPERAKKIQEAAAYLRKHMPDIAIRATDPAARNGGATEPHVSHVLSNRLSSRPKGWSEKTLQFFAPILANGPDVVIDESVPIPINASLENAAKTACRNASRISCNASFSTATACLVNRKKSPLAQALYGLSHPRMC